MKATQKRATSFPLTKESKRILQEARSKGTLMHVVVNEGIKLWERFNLKKDLEAA